MHFERIGLITDRDHNHTHYIAMKFCRMAYDGMKAGKPYWLASPVQELTREQAGYILANFNYGDLN